MNPPSLSLSAHTNRLRGTHSPVAFPVVVSGQAVSQYKMVMARNCTGLGVATQYLDSVLV